MWLVIALIWVALMVAIVWAYRRKRKISAVARARKLEALLTEARLGSTPDAPAGSAPPAAAGSAISPATAAGSAIFAAAVKVEPAQVSEIGKKQRLLAPADATLYYVFRTGLPDHEIFANLTLADVVEVAPTTRGYDRELKLRKLAQQRLDLVICTKALEVVAAVLAGKGAAPDAAAAANALFVEECLQTAGVRLIRINAAAPPRHHEVRRLIYDAAG